MSSFLLRAGGKHFLSKHLINIFQQKEYKRFVDVFGGAGHVTFALMKSSKNTLFYSDTQYIFNDFDENLTNLFIQIQNNSSRLISKLKRSIYGRAYFKHCLKNIKEKTCKSNLQRAVYFFVVNRMSFGADERTFGLQSGNRTNHKRAETYYNNIKQLKQYIKLIKNMSIENQDFEKLIKVYDTSVTLFYCDPPYYNYEKYYEGFSKDDHERLSNVLNRCKGSVVLSYYPFELMDTYYPQWKRIEIDHRSLLTNERVSTNDNKRIEIILIKP